MGYEPVYFDHDDSIPGNVDFLFSFAPYGRFLPIAQQIRESPAKVRPFLIHWNFESLPNVNIPWWLQGSIASRRSWFDRLQNTNHPWIKSFLSIIPYAALNARMYKYRYLGEYHHAYHQGWLKLFCDISEIFANYHLKRGINCRYTPWGTPPEWYTDLNLERDIDVLWFGKRRTRRRSRLLDQVRSNQEKHEMTFYVADNIENPFIFGDLRTRILNRSKITLNILPTWYDPALIFRFHMAAGNRSLVISEPVLPHCPEIVPGEHYIQAPPQQLSETILYFLENDKERKRITDNAYELVTTRLTLRNSLLSIMQAADQHMKARE